MSRMFIRRFTTAPSLRPLQHRLLGDKQLERTFVAIKPDGVQRGLVGNVLSRFEDRGLKLVGTKIVLPTRDIAERHYEEHRDRAFFERACRFICAGPVVASVWEGFGAVRAARGLCGSTDPLDSPPGTIRGDLAIHWRRNVVHSSDGVDSATREINLWFDDHELIQWDQNMAHWISELPNAPIAFDEENDPSEHPGHLDGSDGPVNPELPLS